MGRQTINIQEEEDLALEVKKFLCLYDKRCVLCTKTTKANAWRKVEESLGLEDGKHICLYISSDLQEYSILYSNTSCVETQCGFFFVGSTCLIYVCVCVCVCVGWGGGGGGGLGHQVLWSGALLGRSCVVCLLGVCLSVGAGQGCLSVRGVKVASIPKNFWSARK